MLGTLYAVYSSGMTISREDREMLGAIVTQATVAITNARLYEQSNRRGEDLRSLVQQVSESVTAAGQHRPDYGFGGRANTEAS